MKFFVKKMSPENLFRSKTNGHAMMDRADFAAPFVMRESGQRGRIRSFH